MASKKGSGNSRLIPSSFQQYRKAVLTTDKPQVRKELYSRLQKSENIQTQQEANQLLKQAQPIGKKIGQEMGKVFQPERRTFNPQRLNIQPPTKAQAMFKEIIGSGERTWGTGQNLPQLNKTIISGEGLINNGDNYRDTGRMFGLK